MKTPAGWTKSVMLRGRSTLACCAVGMVAGVFVPMPLAHALEQPLGGLLLSPQERAALDAARRMSTKEQADDSRGAQTSSRAAEGVLPQAAQLLADPMISVAGVVVRNGRKSTIWINDVPLYGADRSNALRQRAASAGVLLDSPDKFMLKVKPGEIVDSANGKRQDVVPEGAVKIRRSGEPPH